jgi:hypothetical protein
LDSTRKPTVASVGSKGSPTPTSTLFGTGAASQSVRRIPAGRQQKIAAHPSRSPFFDWMSSRSRSTESRHRLLSPCQEALHGALELGDGMVAIVLEVRVDRDVGADDTVVTS